MFKAFLQARPATYVIENMLLVARELGRLIGKTWVYRLSELVFVSVFLVLSQYLPTAPALAMLGVVAMVVSCLSAPVDDNWKKGAATALALVLILASTGFTVFSVIPSPMEASWGQILIGLLLLVKTFFLLVFAAQTVYLHGTGCTVGIAKRLTALLGPTIAGPGMLFGVIASLGGLLPYPLGPTLTVQIFLLMLAASAAVSIEKIRQTDQS